MFEKRLEIVMRNQKRVAEVAWSQDEDIYVGILGYGPHAFPVTVRRNPDDGEQPYRGRIFAASKETNVEIRGNSYDEVKQQMVGLFEDDDSYFVGLLIR